METLESLATAVNYHRWLRQLIAPYLGDDPIEIGSGLGDYAAAWVEGGLRRITVSDADPARHARLQERFADNPRVSVRELEVFNPPHANHSAMVAINVLEHIADDTRALQAAHSLLRPDGRVIVLVPAFQCAMSRFDRAAGHERRYRRGEMAATFAKAGIRLDRMHYVNAPGLVAWFLGMRLLRLTPRDGWIVRLWDRLVVPIARTVENRIRPPFGQSLLAVGTCPSGGER